MLAGLGLVLVGVNTTMWVGAIGFAVMVASAVFAATPPRKARLGVVRAGRQPPTPTPRGRKKGQRSFMDRLDERWERRQNNW